MVSINRICCTGLVVLLIGAVVWQGCSDDPNVTGLRQTSDNTEILTYFPLDEGYTTVYQVTSPGGVTSNVQYRVGAKESFRLDYATPWMVSTTDGEYATFYLVATPEALYYYASEDASPEKILKLPLTVGMSWNRFEGNNDTTIITGYDTNDNDSIILTGGDPSLVSFPVAGSTIMTVAGIQPLELEDGPFFSHALKITSDDYTRGVSNHYWFVAGVGLVRWCLGVRNDNEDYCEETGELVRYGF